MRRRNLDLPQQDGKDPGPDSGSSGRQALTVFIHHDAKGWVSLAVGRRAKEDHKGLPGPHEGFGILSWSGAGLCTDSVCAEQSCVCSCGLERMSSVQ